MPYTLCDGDDLAVPLEAILDVMHGDLPRESDGMFEEGPDGVVSRAKAHQENNMLLGSLEMLESAGLTGLTRASVKIFQ